MSAASRTGRARAGCSGTRTSTCSRSCRRRGSTGCRCGITAAASGCGCARRRARSSSTPAITCSGSPTTSCPRPRTASASRRDGSHLAAARVSFPMAVYVWEDEMLEVLPGLGAAQIRADQGDRLPHPQHQQILRRRLCGGAGRRMIHVPTNPAAHYAGDLVAWVAAALAARWQHQRWPEQARRLSRTVEPSYFIALGLGRGCGRWLFGSANSLRALRHRAVAQHRRGARRRDRRGRALEARARRSAARPAARLVRPICARDRRRPARLPVRRPARLHLRRPDRAALGGGPRRRHRPPSGPALRIAGDGSFSLALYPRAAEPARSWARDHAFHALIIFYAGQRFLWEFLKPYPRLLGPLNVFHLLMIGLVAYGIIWWRRDTSTELRTA